MLEHIEHLIEARMELHIVHRIIVPYRKIQGKKGGILSGQAVEPQDRPGDNPEQI
jgi:hypothetical protein